MGVDLSLLHVIEEHVEEIVVLALRPLQAFRVVPVHERGNDADVDVLVRAERALDVLPEGTITYFDHNEVRIGRGGFYRRFNEGISWKGKGEGLVL